MTFTTYATISLPNLILTLKEKTTSESQNKLLTSKLRIMKNLSSNHVSRGSSIALYIVLFSFFFFHCFNDVLAQNNSHWDDFLNQQKDWKMMINPQNHNVHRAYGKSIPIEGYSRINDANAEEAARAFLSQNNEYFPIPLNQLVLKSEYSYDGKYFLFFHQRIKNAEIYNSEISLVLHESGKVMTFGYECFELNDQSTIKDAKYNAQQLLGLTNSNYPQKGTKVRLKDTPLYYAEVINNQTVLTPVYKCTVHNRSDEVNEQLIVSAIDGEVLQRNSGIHNHNVKVKGGVKQESGDDPITIHPLANLNITINGTQYTTDANGDITGIPDAGSYNYSGTFTGPFSNIVNNNAFSGAINTENEIILNDESVLQARNVFYHQNIAHNYVKSIDPQFTALDLALPTTVSGDGVCNAYYSRRGSESDLGSFMFMLPGQVPGTSYECMDLSYIPSIVYHEYGHAINDYLFFQLGNNDGMRFGSCNEGAADVFAAFILHNPVIGEDFFVGGGEDRIRHLENNLRYPEDYIPMNVHFNGQILSGAFWDLKNLTSYETAGHIFHFAKYAQPDDPDDGLAYNEWFIASLIADDDDGDLSTPSPNQEAIITAFNNHGIGTSLYMLTRFHHNVIQSTDVTNVPYTGTFTLSPNISLLNESDVTVVYSTDDFTTQDEITPTFTNGEYTFNIPAQPLGTMVKYYIKIIDSHTNTEFKFPEGYPETAEPYKFLVGYTVIFDDNFESNLGWTFNNVTDSHWDICTPERSVMNDAMLEIETQPSSGFDDGSGTQCLVTGCSSNLQNTNNDEALNPVFDCSLYNHVVVDFNCYMFTHKNEGYMSVYVSGDNGVNWHLIEDIGHEAFTWRQYLYNIGDYISDFSSLQFKLVSHSNNGTTNILVDNFKVFAYNDEASINEVAKPISTISIYPNPTNGILNIKISSPNESKKVTQISLFDSYGRRLESLLSSEKYIDQEILSFDISEYSHQFLFLKVQIEGEKDRYIKVINK